MSDFVSRKAIRYKIKKKLTFEEWDNLFLKYDFEGDTLKNKYKLKHQIIIRQALNWETDEIEHYLDILLDDTYGKYSHWFTKSRYLTEDEIQEYLEDFQKINKEIKAEDLRYVFYCYYNGVDAKSCYEIGEWEEEI